NCRQGLHRCEQSLEGHRSLNSEYHASACRRWSWREMTIERSASGPGTSQERRCPDSEATWQSRDIATRSSGRSEESELETRSHWWRGTECFGIVCRRFG